MNNGIPVMFAVIFTIAGFCFGLYLGDQMGQDKTIRELSKHCIVECGKCGGINRVLPASCEGKVEIKD